MSTRALLVPATSFILAILLSLIAGPSKPALSRQAGGGTGCEPNCSVTDTAQQVVAAATPRRPGYFIASEEIVDTLTAKTGNVGAVTVTANAWSVDLQSSPPGNEGGGGSRLRATIRLRGADVQTILINRVIAYGSMSLPGEHTVTGSASATASGLETCSPISGTVTWDLGAFAVYVSPRGTKRSIAAVASGAGWSCAAQ